MEPRVRSFLLDMLEHAEHAIRFVEGTSETEFQEDLEKQFAVVRAIEVVGEAAKSISDDVRNELSAIPWRQITTMRDKLIHHYFGVESAIVWATAKEDLPLLARTIRDYLKEYDIDP